MKFFPLPCIILAAFAFSGCGSGKADKAAAGRSKTHPIVEGLIVSPSNLRQIVTVSGTLKPFDETVLMPEVNGRVTAVTIPEGRFVKQGTLLVKLFDGDLQAQLAKVEAQLKITEQTEKRQAELLKVNGVSQSDYDQAFLQVSSVKADVEVLKMQIRKTEVLAPFDGVVGLKNISPGAGVTPGTPLTTLRAMHRLKLDFSAPERYGALIKAGMALTFFLQQGGRTYDARVIATEEGIETSSRTLKVRAEVASPGAELLPGSFVTVTLLLGENRDALMIPTQTLIPQEQTHRVILAKNGKAAFTEVKTGAREASTVEVVSGLSAGDTVVTTGLMFLKPGMPLKFSKVAR
ncbi:MAG: efflux RND transporter periplasmic adaptor subunit [Fibrobacterota bacterium]